MASHQLNIDPRYKHVCQKLRNISTERGQTMENEVKKLLKNGSLREVTYPDWLSNIVMVTKANGK